MYDFTYIWLLIIGFGVLMYVLTDGFDLGVGILFPFARSEQDRDIMMNTVAPVWDGNETWLVLGGAGLLAAFPLVYSVFLPALYIGVFLMLAGLIFRGVAFEFRFKAAPNRRGLWNVAFFGGSLVATFAQGAVVGTFIQGFETENFRYVGGPLDWLTPFTVMTGLGMVAGYGLLGATWLLLKTEGETQKWARGWAYRLLAALMVFFVVVSLWTPLTDTLRAQPLVRSPDLALGAAGRHGAGRGTAVAIAEPQLRGHAVHLHHRPVRAVLRGPAVQQVALHGAAQLHLSRCRVGTGESALPADRAAVRDPVRTDVLGLDLLRVPGQGARRRRVSLITGSGTSERRPVRSAVAARTAQAA
jgi:hypothetical protein